MESITRNDVKLLNFLKQNGPSMRKDIEESIGMDKSSIHNAIQRMFIHEAIKIVATKGPGSPQKISLTKYGEQIVKVVKL